MPHSVPRLLTLGRCELVIETSTGPRSLPTQAKRLALLAYLAAALPGEERALQALLRLFWPDHNTRDARRAIQQALYHLHRQTGFELITVDPAELVCVSPLLRSDGCEFEQAILERRFADAVALYRGPFLGNLNVLRLSPEFEEWKERTRVRMRASATHAAWQIAMEAESRGDDAAAAHAAIYAHELEPLDETGLQRLLELLHRQRDRAAATRVYQGFTDRLKLERGLEPAPETVALFESIKPPPRSSSRVPVRGLTPNQQRAFDAAVQTRVATDTGVGDLEMPLFQPAPRVYEPAPSQGARRFAQALLMMVIVGPLSYAIAATRPFVTAGARAAVLQPHDQVLVSDFSSQSRDSTLGIALAEALRADMSLSPRVRVLSTTQTRALRPKKRPAQGGLDSLMRARAVREGVKAFVISEVSNQGGTFLISTQLVAAPSGDVLAAARATAKDSTELLAAIDRVSAQLRKRMGEATPQIEAEPPLERVTTASLPALRKFSQALYLLDVLGDRTGAIRLLEEALALDTSFAAAHCRLGVLYADVGEPARAARALERAFALRDRLPLRERYLTLGGYHHVVTREYDKAASAYRSLLDLYPEDLTGLISLARVYADDRQFARAENFFQRVLMLDSTLAPAHLGRAEVFINESRFDSARVVLDHVWKNFPDYGETRLAEAHLATAHRDWPAVEQHLLLQYEAVKGQLFEELNALQSLGQIALIRGRLLLAQQYLNRALQLADSSHSAGRYLTQSILLSWLELRYQRQPALALARIDTALARFPIAQLDPAERPYLELAALYVAAGEPARASALLNDAEQDSAATTLRGGGMHYLRGLVAVAEGRAADAVTQLQQADTLDRCTICVLPSLAEAHRLSGDTAAAITTYERYLNTSWSRRFQTDALHLSWTLRQLGELYDKQRQRPRAIDQYTRLARLWVSADPQLKAEANAFLPRKPVVRPASRTRPANCYEMQCRQQRPARRP